MEKRDGADLFVNDGSFFEKFKKLQQEKENAEQIKSGASAGAAVGTPKPTVLVNKRPLDSKVIDGKKTTASTSGGKLAFSLKQKSKVAITPVKFAADEEEERGEAEGGTGEELCKRQKLGQVDATQPPSVVEDVAPSPPSDPTVRKVADKLASFVAKNGRQFEHITRQRNPGDTPFKFLFDSSSPDYKYYMSRLLEEEKALADLKEPQSSNSTSVNTSTSRSSNVSQRRTIQQHSNYQAPSSTSSSRVSSVSTRSNIQPQSNYQTPASALYGTYEETVNIGASSSGESGGSSAADSVAMMEFYMKKAAHEERKRPPKLSKDEMPPPSSQGPGKKGHHMGDYIPQEELEKFLASCNDAAAQKAAREAAEKAKIQADNIGHKLLSKMGWKEGEGLGSDRSGRADPVMAGSVKLNNLGVGAHQPGEVTAEDDIYEQYKKRMMLGYRHRPNPLNNPRKSYY